MLARSLLAAAAFVASTLAVQTATVVIEASHGGAENGLTNTTVSISINHIYDNATALAEVSTLYLIGSTNVPIDSITCTPFRNTDGSGNDGDPFNSTYPSYLSTNTVKVGSIVCITSAISMAPPGLPISSRAPAVTVTTHTNQVAQTTSTSVKTVTPNSDATATESSAAASSTSSASASASSGNSASALYLSGEFFGGLALAGFGVAFVL